MKNYKYTALIGLKNINPELPTGNYYQHIFVTRNLAVAKNSLHSRYPEYTLSVILELSNDILDNELELIKLREERANYIIRNKQRQTKFEIKQTQLQQFYYSDKAEFTKYLNNLKTRIECDWENNKFYLNKKIGGIWTHSNKDEISFRKLTEICIEQERKKLVIIDNQQDINKDKEIENLKKINKELNKKLESMKSKNIDNKENTNTENSKLIQQLQDENKKLQNEIEYLKKINKELEINYIKNAEIKPILINYQNSNYCFDVITDEELLVNCS